MGFSANLIASELEKIQKFDEIKVTKNLNHLNDMIKKK